MPTPVNLCSYVIIHDNIQDATVDGMRGTILKSTPIPLVREEDRKQPWRSNERP